MNVRDLEIFRRGADTLLAGDRAGAFVKLKPEIGTEDPCILSYFLGGEKYQGEKRKGRKYVRKEKKEER